METSIPNDMGHRRPYLETDHQPEFRSSVSNASYTGKLLRAYEGAFRTFNRALGEAPHAEQARAAEILGVIVKDMEKVSGQVANGISSLSLLRFASDEYRRASDDALEKGDYEGSAILHAQAHDALHDIGERPSEEMVAQHKLVRELAALRVSVPTGKYDPEVVKLAELEALRRRSKIPHDAKAFYTR